MNGVSERELHELKEQLDGIKWGINYGSVKLQIKAGKVTLVTVEETMRLD